MTSFSTYLDIMYDETRQLLLGRWKRAVMPFELQQGYAAILDAATEAECRFWLLDIRCRTTTDASDVLWMVEEFLPLLRPHLGRTTYIALLMAPHHLAGALATISSSPSPDTDEQPYLLQRFTEESAALAWLESCLQQDSVER